MPIELLTRLLDALPRPTSGETTVEANPEDVDALWVAGARRAGATRLSLGVQSFQRSTASRLGRARSQAHAEDACRRAADHFSTWSVDLIFGVAGQDAGSLDADLDAVERLGAPHLSAYGLTIEPGTKFGSARRARPNVDDETWRALYDRVVARARASGLRRYEVSNFARRGHESRHNTVYWSGRPYAGLGPGAAGLRPDGSRTANVADVSAWLSGAPTLVERPEPRAEALDRMWPALRRPRGVDLVELQRRTGHRPRPRVVDELVRAGLLRRRRGRVAATDEGMALADGLARRLADALEEGSVDPAR
jgi:oxygen-independent coproporphyrinogen-3 oxidase